jgi:hypothetical protein
VCERIAMRSSPAEIKPAMAPTTGEDAATDGASALREMVERIDAERAACEQLGDPELAQRAERKLLTAVACAADAVLGDARTLYSAPDKVGAFFDKSATACVAAIEGLHKRAVLNDAAADEFAPGRSRAGEPFAGAYAMWGPPASCAPRE